MRHNWAMLGLAIEDEPFQAYVTLYHPLSSHRLQSAHSDSFSPGENF